MPHPVILHLALPVPLRRSFAYLPPENDPTTPLPGCRYQVPFGNQTLVGILLYSNDTSPIAIEKLKKADSRLDDTPVLSNDLLNLINWTANYYHQPLGEVFTTALPTLLRQGRPAISIEQEYWFCTDAPTKDLQQQLKRAPKQKALLDLLATSLHPEQRTTQQLNAAGYNKSLRDALVTKGLLTCQPAAESSSQTIPLLKNTPLELTTEQALALNSIELHKFSVTLLQGATGSGKTEVYLQLAEKILRQGKQVLFLVPEIGLTPQTLERIETRFNTCIHTLHSGLNDSERLQTWLYANQGKANIVVGTRSAIFTDFANLGLIILDEEHDLSFKQQDGLRYSARDLAVIRGQQRGIPVLLGSATPSLESMLNAQQGKYQLSTLHQRPGALHKPDIRFVDLRNRHLNAGMAEETLLAVRKTLDKKQQALIFLNRRGYAPTLMCKHCGWVCHCRHCDARMTLHSQPRHLRCHHCDFQRPVPKTCPDCQNTELDTVGQGTEQTEQTLQQLFPDVPTWRIDRDSTRRKQAMHKIISDILQGEPAILVGTQMLAKGHHFPNVTLVVIADADASLFSSDFRGPERMGQLLTQVAGRAGREALKGLVLIQTFHPHHPGFDTLISRGYATYAHAILSERKATQMPPYTYMAYLRAESKRSENALQLLREALKLSHQFITQHQLNVQFLGPMPAPIEKKNDRFRQVLQINATKRGHLQHLLHHLIPLLENHALGKRCRWAIDVDPQEQS